MSEEFVFGLTVTLVLVLLRKDRDFARDHRRETDYRGLRVDGKADLHWHSVHRDCR